MGGPTEQCFPIFTRSRGIILQEWMEGAGKGQRGLGATTATRTVALGAHGIHASPGVPRSSQSGDTDHSLFTGEHTQSATA
jgi:hypothetical protein